MNDLTLPAGGLKVQELTHVKRRLGTAALSILLFSGSGVMLTRASAAPAGAAAAPAEQAAASSPSQTEGVFKDLEALLKEFFPKAKVTTSGKSMHFEFKAHERVNSYSNKNEMSPDLGGIFGDLEVKSGQHKDKDKLPLERSEIVHSVLLMAPYSAPDNDYLNTRLLFQPDTPIDFMDRFKAIVNGFKKEDPSLAKKEEVNTPVASVPAATTVAVAPAASASTVPPTATPAAATPPASSPSTTFGASKLSKYTYPEGRFRVLLPGNPQMKYSTQAGMRMVDYAYPETQGSFNVSYVILPQQANTDALALLIDKLAASVVKSVNGVDSKQYPTSLQGFPGREIEIAQIKDKPGQSARFKLYVVRRFVYIVGVAGKNAWRDSPIAKQFIDSFECTPELTAAEEAQQRSRDFDRQRRLSEEDSRRKQAEWDVKFHEGVMRNQKESEHSHAEFENNRYRRP